MYQCIREGICQYKTKQKKTPIPVLLLYLLKEFKLFYSSFSALFLPKNMEPVCFLCQEYEIDIGHQTILCPKQFCKICQQKGHFAMNCKTFCKDFVTKDEQMVKIENDDETKTEIHFDDLPCKVETKTENYITVRKDLFETENRNCGEFPKSEEDSLESMPPKDTKKRKIDSELSVEKDLSLEEVQQKLIEKLNILNQLHQSEIKDLRQRLSKNALIIGKQGKELKTLCEEKMYMYQSTSSKSSELKSSQLKLGNLSCALKKYQSRVLEQSKELKSLRENKEKMAFGFKDKWQEKEREKLHVLFARESFKLNDIIEKLKNEIHTLWESKEKMELEWNNELVGKKSEIELLQTQFTQKIFKLNDTIGKQRKHIDTLLEKLK
jgi:hypothetical protein